MRQGVGLRPLHDELVDLKLCSLYDEVHTIEDSDSIVVWEELACKADAEGLGNVAGAEAPLSAEGMLMGQSLEGSSGSFMRQKRKVLMKKGTMAGWAG